MYKLQQKKIENFEIFVFNQSDEQCPNFNFSLMSYCTRYEIEHLGKVQKHPEGVGVTLFRAAFGRAWVPPPIFGDTCVHPPIFDNHLVSPPIFT